MALFRITDAEVSDASAGGMLNADLIYFFNTSTSSFERLSLQALQSFTGFFRPVADVAELQGIDTTDLLTGSFCFVQELEQFFRLDADSEAVADNVTVIQPTIGGGRWLEFTSGGDGDFSKILTDPATGAVLVDSITGNVLTSA